MRFLIAMFGVLAGAGCAGVDKYDFSESAAPRAARTFLDQSAARGINAIYEDGEGVRVGVFGEIDFEVLPADYQRQGRRLYTLKQDMAFVDFTTCETVYVPSGFVSDFASIPKEQVNNLVGQLATAHLLSMILTGSGLGPIMPGAYALQDYVNAMEPSDYAVPALFHDFLYARGDGDEASRARADGLFLLLLIADGAPSHDVAVMYLAVEKFGAGGYGLESDWAFQLDAATPPGPGPMAEGTPWIKLKTSVCDRLERKLAKTDHEAQMIDLTLRVDVEAMLRQAVYEQAMTLLEDARPDASDP